MPPRLSWTDVIPGLIALGVLIAIGVGVLMFAGVGKVHGDTIRIHLLTDQARGVMQGTEVWLDGQKVGAVERVGFRPPSEDTLHRVVITAEVLEEPAQQLRRDSRIQVRPGGNVIGPVVIFIESGTPTGAVVRSGDTLRALAQSDAEILVEDLGAAAKQLPGLMADAKTVLAHARGGDGTVGLFLTRGLPADEMRALRRNLAGFGIGSAGSRDEPRLAAARRHVSSAMARVDSIRTLLASPATSLGRFRRDSTLARRVSEITSELDSLRAAIDDSRGTLYRLRSDSAVVRGIAEARAEMALLFDDIMRRPMRYIHF